MMVSSKTQIYMGPHYLHEVFAYNSYTEPLRLGGLIIFLLAIYKENISNFGRPEP